MSCFVSVIYGDNCHGRRESLWADLLSCASAFRGSPWLVFGDFNAIRKQNERVGGSRDWPNWMDSLDECIIEADLDDFKFGGHFFTWSNRREEGPILRKLDRALVNSEWDSRFSGSEATFLPPGVSDHSPVVVKVAEMPRSRKPFRFFNFWADHPGFLPLVREVWLEDIQGSPMFQLCSKLKIWKRK